MSEKKGFWKIAFTVLFGLSLVMLALAFTSCEGPIGPQGPQGGVESSIITICPNTGNWLIYGLDTGLSPAQTPASDVTIKQDAESGYWYWYLDGIRTNVRLPSNELPPVPPPSGKETVFDPDSFIGLYNPCLEGGPVFTLISDEATEDFLALRIGPRANPWSGLGISFAELIAAGTLSHTGRYTVTVEGIAGIPATGNVLLRSMAAGETAWNWVTAPLANGRPFKLERNFIMAGIATPSARITSGPLAANTNLIITNVTITNANGEIQWSISEAEKNTDITEDFVNATFRAEVRRVAGLGAADPITLVDVASITSMTLTGGATQAARINNFAGLEHFRSLEFLDINNHHAGTGADGTPENGRNGIDISVLPRLREFRAIGVTNPQFTAAHGMQWIIIDNPLLEVIRINPAARLESLDFSKAPALEVIELNRTFTGTSANPTGGLSSVDISQNLKLREFSAINSVRMAGLDTSNNTALEFLRLGGRADTGNTRQINLTNNINLRTVWLNSDGLESFNWPTLTKLEVLNLNSSPLVAANALRLKSVNLANHPLLREFRANDSEISSFDFSNNPAIQEIYINWGLVENISFQNNNALRVLELEDNKFQTLAITGAPNLQELILRTNELTSINISTLTKLEFLDLGWNKLTTLNVSALTSLRDIRVNHNELTGLDISSLANLEHLNISNNRLTGFDAVVGWLEFRLRPPGQFVFFPQHVDVFGPVLNVPVITTPATIPAFTVGEPVFFMFEASGNNSFVWTVVNWPEGNPPAAETGLILDAMGFLYGTPTAAAVGTWNFTVRAARNMWDYDERVFTFTVNAQ